MFIELWRGVPLITVLFMAAVMLPLFLPDGMTLDKLLRALIGVSLFAGAYMAEVVRGGLQAVPRGQIEAAQALGLSGYQIFTLVVFPQALRIVLPPVISQFLNLTKNSSLAPLAGYAELFVVAGIVANQTGASIPIALLLVVSYLTISLAFAYVLNVVNDRLALVER